MLASLKRLRGIASGERVPGGLGMVARRWRVSFRTRAARPIHARRADARMAYFTRDTLRFLAELERHNERAWFLENKDRYEAHVKEPAGRLIADVGPKLGMDGKLMRVNRDVRFSKDKSPYKTNVGIGFHPSGLPKGPLIAGLYLHVAPKESFIATGVWQPEPAILGKIRDAIVARPAPWKAARKVGLDEDETALKRAPKGFDPEHPHVEDLKRKSFTASVPLTSAQATSADLPKLMVAAEKKMRRLNEFLAAAVRV